VVGDGTFYHSAIPALVNAINNKSNLTLVILDNETTAMTGFQPHPGTGYNAMGDEVQKVPIEDICRGLGVKVVIADPYDVKDTTEKILELIGEEGVKVLILRQKCSIMMAREGKLYNVTIDPEKCVGEECGCARFCTRAFKCPGIVWDDKAKKARIDEAICVGCGVCAQICPHGAIIREPVKAKEVAKV
jgi:indolepyruvate ferredoxin oxidoreductase alpha subunit